MYQKRIANESRPCAVCGDRNEAAELSLRRERHEPGSPPEAIGAVHRYPLCGSDFEWAVGVVERSGRGLAPGETPLGMPVREAAAVSAGQQCGGCNATIGAEVGVLDLVPSTRQRGAGLFWRHSGRIYQVRLCRQCRAWWETTLRDVSAVRGEGVRAWEGPAGGWLAASHADVATIGLGARDEQTVAATVGAVGRHSQRLQFEDLARLETPPGVLFVGANRAGRAGRVVSRLPNPFRRACVVVGRPDALDDLAEALRAGAGDFLAWPLSPQQVAGAIDRAHAGTRPAEHDPGTGLPLVGDDIAIHKRPAHRLTAELPAGMDLLEGALLARRFLRGYDIVGVSTTGHLAVAVACEPAHLPGVMERMELVFGEGARAWEGDPPAETPAEPEASAPENPSESPSEAPPEATSQPEVASAPAAAPPAEPAETITSIVPDPPAELERAG